jgi:hypothetical protein
VSQLVKKFPVVMELEDFYPINKHLPLFCILSQTNLVQFQSSLHRVSLFSVHISISPTLTTFFVYYARRVSVAIPPSSAALVHCGLLWLFFIVDFPTFDAILVVHSVFGSNIITITSSLVLNCLKCQYILSIVQSLSVVHSF